jgi:hypothetical protein
MFSGRITDAGSVVGAGRGLVIEAHKTAGALSAGGSVNAAGACLPGPRGRAELPWASMIRA